MDWTQTLTIILTIGASTAAVWYVVKEDIKLVREGVKTEISLIREGIKTEISLMLLQHMMTLSKRIGGIAKVKEGFMPINPTIKKVFKIFLFIVSPHEI